MGPLTMKKPLALHLAQKKCPGNGSVTVIRNARRRGKEYLGEASLIQSSRLLIATSA